MANHDGISLNQFTAAVVAVKFSTLRAARDFLEQRPARPGQVTYGIHPPGRESPLDEG